jgi:hypothetical protein
MEMSEDKKVRLTLTDEDMITSPRLSRRTLLAGVGLALGTVALAGRSAMAEEKDKADAEADKGDAEDKDKADAEDKDKADAEADKEVDKGDAEDDKDKADAEADKGEAERDAD